MSNLKIKSPATLEQLNGAGAGTSAFAVFNPSSVDLAMGGHLITGLADGVDPTDAVNKGQLDAVGGGYTDEQAQDAVGTILVDSATIDLTYADATPSITAAVVAGSITATYLGDAEIVAIAGLVSAADRGIYFTGAGTAALFTLTSFARTLLDDPDAATARATLGVTASPLTTKGDLWTYSTLNTRLPVGTDGQILIADSTQTTGLRWGAAPSGYSDEQAQDAVGGILTDTATIDLSYNDAGNLITADVIDGSITLAKLADAELVALGGLTSAADRLPYFTGAGTAALEVFTSFGRSLVDDADAATARTTLGLGALATKATVGTADIDNDAVTYAKMQNVSATDKLLGRASAGAGDVEEITCTAAGRALLDDADAAVQRTTLGLGTAATQASTAFQAADAELTAISGLVSAADRGIYFTGAATAALFTLTSFARTLLDDPDAATMRTTLGLGSAATQASTAFQAADAELTAIAGLTSAINTVPYFTGSGTAGLLTVTTFSISLLDDTGGHAARQTLGILDTFQPLSGAGSTTINLPQIFTLADGEGYEETYAIKSAASVANTLVVARSGTDTIEGDDSGATLTSITLYYVGDAVTLRADGTSKWFLISEHRARPYCKVNNSTDQTILNATVLAPVAFNGEDSDRYDMHSTVTNNSRITVKRPGVYRWKGVAHFDSGNLGTTRQVICYKNGVAQTSGTKLPNDPNGQKIVAWTDEFSCAAGDYFEMGVYQDNGGSILLKSQFTRMSLEFISG